MAKRKRQRQKQEKDSVYFLKLLMFFLLGAFWLRITLGNGAVVGLPIGLVAGLLLASHDHFAIDRKIEYAVLLIATALSAYIPIVGFWI
jgi:apolipoprotein N-acyltransferase